MMRYMKIQKFYLLNAVWKKLCVGGGHVQRKIQYHDGSGV